LVDFEKLAFRSLVLLCGMAFQAWAQAPSSAPAAKPVHQAPPAPRRGFAGAGGEYKDYDPATLEAGQRIFSANCAFCHGSSAKGGESGPDLLRSVTVLHDENGELIGKVLQNGRVDKGMPKFSFTPEQVDQVAAFLHDAVRAAAQRGTYKILDILVGNATAGQAYFNGAGNCTSCHSVTGDLAHIASKYDAVNLQQKVVMPREGRSANTAKSLAVTVTVTFPSGEVVNGVLNKLDDFAVSLTGENGDYHSFSREGDVPKVELHDPMKGHFALLKQYTDADIHNLTSYLETLK
jgi:mono/diheme cytochrome c family protein